MGLPEIVRRTSISLRARIHGLFYKLHTCELLFSKLSEIQYPHLKNLDAAPDGRRHITVLASNVEEAWLMHDYIKDEGLEA